MNRASWVIAGACFAVACSDTVEEDEVPGALGNGKFRYECVEPSDPACAGRDTAGDFPDRVGLDGLFDVGFEEFEDHNPGLVRVEPAAPEIIDEQNQLFRAVQQGTTALLALRARDGRVIDFVHMEVAPVAEVRLEDAEGASPRVSWQTGDEQVLRATALDAGRAVLAGARDFEWSTSEPDIVRLERANPAAEMELLPIAPGTTTISVVTADVTADLEVTVDGDPLPSPRPDGGAADAGDARAPDSGDAGPTWGEAGAAPADGGPEAGDRSTDAGVADTGVADATSPDAALDGSSSNGDGGAP